PTPPRKGASETSAWSFRRANSRRRRRSMPTTRPRSRSGGRSSRQRTSRENKSGSRLAFQGSNMMKLPRRNFLHLAAGAAALPAISRFAWAQVYPTRPVRWIVGFPPGGGADTVARIAGQWLSDRLGQPVIIENKPGGGTNISVQAVVNSPP